ncbi:glycosyltransferase family 39 protein [Variovorax paradoxus]|nr:glycosyltransferase family 39 protein [Variovorax paradoxus]MBT2304884.1 glycosyltransferase family 39 protein [Variovorax paradoxus]
MRLSRACTAVLRTSLSIAGIFLWLAATAWFRPLMAPDEGRYVGVAFEMLRSGDWLVPRLDGLPFFHKPPLFYWISAAAMSVLGTSEWPARLPSILGATIAAAGLLLFLRRWADAAGAKLSVVVLVTMPFFYIGAQFANLDMLVGGCIAATVLLAAHATLSKERGLAWRSALAGAFLLASLGVLAKGLIGIVLPALVFVVWCAATRRLRAAWLMAWPPGWVVFLAIASPWFVAMQMRYPAFFDYFIVTQHFRRFAASGFNNQHPLWFYLPVIAGLTLPWFGWLGAGRWNVRGTRPRLSDVDWLMAIWCLSIVVFFSAPRSKLIGYVLPALPPLAYLIAKAALAAASGSKQLSRPLRWTAALAGLVCIACVAFLGLRVSQPSTRLRLPAGQIVGPADQVLMLDAYYYELPLHWGLPRPVMVSGDWTAGAAGQRDDWRKELYDAGRFEPERGAMLLIDTGRIPEALCVPQPSWLVGPSNAQLVHPWFAHAHLVAFNSEAAVWRFSGSPARDGHCLEMPKAGSPRTSAPP